MKKITPFISFLFCMGLTAQTALYNGSGNMQLHNGAFLGVHTNFINDASFNQTTGLIGFYGNTFIDVSGTVTPTFFNVEIDNPFGVFLNTTVNVTNNTNFIIGDIETPKSIRTIYYNFMEDHSINGHSDFSKVNGFCAIENRQDFSFPVGDTEQLRPLFLTSESVNTQAKCAYFFENPNNPSAFATSFNTTRKSKQVDLVSELEFWRLEGSVPSTITVSWNERSNISLLADEFYKMGLVGWHKVSRQWERLSGEEAMGDLDQGFVVSETFIPDDYEVITLASLAIPTRLLELDNYIVTPNGDGTNDVLVIEELEESPNNSIAIFNRHGQKVFQKENYTNEFNGFSNMNNLVLSRNKGLPAGIYFYVAKLKDLNKEYQGYLYLNR